MKKIANTFIVILLAAVLAIPAEATREPQKGYYEPVTGVVNLEGSGRYVLINAENDQDILYKTVKTSDKFEVQFDEPGYYRYYFGKEENNINELYSIIFSVFSDEQMDKLYVITEIQDWKTGSKVNVIIPSPTPYQPWTTPMPGSDSGKGWIRTGDDSNIQIYTIAAVLASIIMTAILICYRKKQNLSQKIIINT